MIEPRDPEFMGRSASISFATEASPEERAKRLLPHLKDAAGKFRLWPERAGHIAIAVIDVPIDYNPDVVYGVIRDEVRQNQAEYRYTDAVIWRRIAWHISPNIGQVFGLDWELAAYHQGATRWGIARHGPVDHSSPRYIGTPTSLTKLAQGAVAPEFFRECPSVSFEFPWVATPSGVA